jgi:hypothetical protein
MNDNNLNNIAYELFGSMRYLTPEENERKKEMYRNMSTAINETELFDKEKDNDR